ncbi:hypothetical protein METBISCDRAFT_22372 [Metschnikowia bicuspidata]|uniref:AMP-activated protein kinase glycogen-binding domain-containing protein n=1 Tax=Metschnikowia bicuspidata TaxID=27322 RepID=A0A4P9ZF79_9ASCO|nr:hypothetical protein METBISCDRAFT_22372 [Metschnikowia bicuspidata]
MSSNYTFKCYCPSLVATNLRPAGPKEVIVTGTFDEWSNSLPLVKQVDGSFELTVPLPTNSDILYKYVVDSEWLINSDEAKITDDNGIENNLLFASALSPLASENPKIPESGGLPVALGAVQTKVMPKEEPKMQMFGKPGIFVPKDPEMLAAFETVSNVDPKTLNRPEQPVEEKKKPKKKLKRTKFKTKRKEGGAAAATTSVGLATPPVTAPTASETESSLAQYNEGGVSSETEPEAIKDELAASAKDNAAPLETTEKKLVPAETAAPVETPVNAAVPVEAPAKAAEEQVTVNAKQKQEASAPLETLDPAVIGTVAPVGDAEETTDDPIWVSAAMAATGDSAKDNSKDALPVNKDEEKEIIIADGANLSKEIGNLSACATGQEVEEIKPSPAESKKFTEAAKLQKDEAYAKSKTEKTEVKEKKKGFFSKLKKIFE